MSTTKKKPNKERKNVQRIIPHTERSASGHNWDAYKSSTKEKCSKEDVKKKAPKNQKSKMIHHPLVSSKNHTSQINQKDEHNWDAYKSSIKEKCSKEDVKKKAPKNQMSKMIHHPLVSSKNHTSQINQKDVSDEEKQKFTKHLAIDCEMVGIEDGTKSMIARVSIVNRYGFCIYDKYVKPSQPIQDYRTKISGIRPEDLQNGEEFKIVQKEVADILKQRVLIGHALQHDLKVLYLSHPRRAIRDTSRFSLFRQLSKGNTPSLKKLVHELLGREIQTGEHNSIEDAKAAMQLYVLYKNRWESQFYSKR